MVTVIAFILAVLNSLFPVKGEAQLFTVHYAPELEAVEQGQGDGVTCTSKAKCTCLNCFDLEVYVEAGEEFTRLFNSYETKWSKNGRLMLATSGSSFKFVKKGA